MACESAMRGWILIAAGGVLLWLVVSQLRPSHSGGAEEKSGASEASALRQVDPSLAAGGRFLERPETAISRGPLIAPDPAEARPVARPSRTAPEATLLAAELAPRANAGAKPREAVPAEGGLSAPTGTRGPAQAATPWTTEDAILLASTLLHEPQGLAAFFASRGGRAPSPTRRRLAESLAAAVQGDRGRAASLAQGLEQAGDLYPGELDVLRAALNADETRAVTASAAAGEALRRDSFLAQAASMALLAREGTRAIDAGQFREGARSFSELLLAEIEAPWEAEPATLRKWSDELHRAQRGWRWNRLGEWPSIDIQVEPGDTLTHIRKRALAQRPDLLICTGLIAAANELRNSMIHPGDVLRVPTDPVSIRVDVSARWIFFMEADEVVAAWQVGVGARGSDTRVGQYTVGKKQTEPMWFRPGQPPVPYGDPKNPLGTRWISWLTPDGRESSLGFHGTNEPDSMGKAVSEGCVRMRNEQVEELFEIVPVGTPIDVRP